MNDHVPESASFVCKNNKKQVSWRQMSKYLFFLWTNLSQPMTSPSVYLGLQVRHWGVVLGCPIPPALPGPCLCRGLPEQGSFTSSGPSSSLIPLHMKRMWRSLSRVRLFATSWTIQSMEFSRPEYWSGQPFPSPGDLPSPGMEPRSPALQTDADSSPAEPPGKPHGESAPSQTDHTRPLAGPSAIAPPAD